MKNHYPLPIEAIRLAAEHEHSALLETSRFDSENHRSLLFLEPDMILRANTHGDMPELLANLERCSRSGLYAAGYLAYEAGHWFEPAAGPASEVSPLALFGVYHKPFIFNHVTGEWNSPLPEPPAEPLGADYGSGNIAPIEDVTFDHTQDVYASHIRNILQHIHEGDTYQINFTMRCRFTVNESPAALYARLKREQPVGYGALFRWGDGNAIVSLSPELFFSTDGQTITARPMKGTAPRGRTASEDAKIAGMLREDEKNRAENLMIVDLLRNDVGRIAKTGTVRVPELFAIERYPTVFQMTSTVVADLKAGVEIGDMLRSLFPCGSITGAPKIRSMRIIAEEEQSVRGVYTGAIGYIGPGREARFSVAIRTIELKDGRGVMGVGGGIVADSTPGAEYKECLLKASFLTTPTPEFALIESIRWENGYPFLSHHFGRLRSSATYFDFALDEEAARTALESVARSLPQDVAHKVKLTIARSGEVAVQVSALDIAPEHLTVSIAEETVDPANRFFFHKTTNRKLYDAGFAAAVQEGHADVLYFNNHGELTEGAISNVVIKAGPRWYTPPIECGLLAGVYRAHLLQTNSRLREKILTKEDLLGAEGIYLCNSVRGLRKVTLAAK